MKKYIIGAVLFVLLFVVAVIVSDKVYVANGQELHEKYADQYGKYRKKGEIEMDRAKDKSEPYFANDIWKRWRFY